MTKGAYDNKRTDAELDDGADHVVEGTVRVSVHVLGHLVDHSIHGGGDHVENEKKGHEHFRSKRIRSSLQLCARWHETGNQWLLQLRRHHVQIEECWRMHGGPQIEGPHSKKAVIDV